MSGMERSPRRTPVRRARTSAPANPAAADPVLQEEDCLRMLRVMILAFRFQVFLFLRLRRARDLIQV